MSAKLSLRGRGVGVALIALAVVAGAPRAHADPSFQPGDGDPLFINYMTTVFQPPTSVAGAQAIIPLAHQVCDARAKGLSDVQAVGLVMTGGGLDRLGVSFASPSAQESAALGIAEVATMAYCPTYNNGNW
jgi:Protein of unknown function (DUF732)